jgi:xanthine dehydrogenase accessory factor
MTHSHDLDEELTAAILRRGDSAYCGLIGSATKVARFSKRLRQRGLTEKQMTRMTSPIGISGISGKAPGEIAVSVAAQILRLRDGVNRHDRRNAPAEISNARTD